MLETFPERHESRSLETTLAQPDYGQLETPGDTLATTRGGGESPVGVPVLCSLDCKKVDVDRGEELMSESHRRTIGIF